jgi:ABC-type amino acid transport system permease subunit
MSSTDLEVSASSISQREWLSLAWGFFWRGLCFTVASGLLGGLAGGILGFVVGLVTVAAGGSAEDIRGPLQGVAALLGFGIGFYLLRYYIRWLLRARFGSLRLALVRPSPSVPAAA